MKGSLYLSAGGRVSLRAAGEKDCEKLREWKNANREFFFFKGIITAEMQKKWFLAYLNRPDDYMFMAVHEQKDFGCLAFRMIDGSADIYNVILGLPEWANRGLMSEAIQIMCSYICSDHTRKIGLKVLNTNPAVSWYVKNGFYENEKFSDYTNLSLDIKKLKTMALEKKTA